GASTALNASTGRLIVICLCSGGVVHPVSPAIMPNSMTMAIRDLLFIFLLVYWFIARSCMMCAARQQASDRVACVPHWHTRVAGMTRDHGCHPRTDQRCQRRADLLLPHGQIRLRLPSAGACHRASAPARAQRSPAVASRPCERGHG